MNSKRSIEEASPFAPQTVSDGIGAGNYSDPLMTSDRKTRESTSAYKYEDQYDSGSKRRRRSYRKGDDYDVASGVECHDEPISDDIDEHVADLKVPDNIEAFIAGSIFQLGLKHASPKVLISIMPKFEGLSTEHVKSHLQKYRIHSSRSTSEFCSFYDEVIHDQYHQFLVKSRNTATSGIAPSSDNFGGGIDIYSSDTNFRPRDSDATNSTDTRGRSKHYNNNDDNNNNSYGNSNSNFDDAGNCKHKLSIIKNVKTESDELLTEWAKIYQETPIFKPI